MIGAVGISSHKGIKLLLKKNGNTADIIEAVKYGDARSKPFTTGLAKRMKAATLEGTCRNIHGFIRRFIPYKIDPVGKQFIQSPGHLWHTKAGDCKSFSVFAGSILQNLGISYGYRFTSYDPSNPTPTHVYVYVPAGAGREIIIDAVWSGPFNTQKPYAAKQDHPMTHAGAVSGIAGNPGLSWLEWLAAGLIVRQLLKSN